MKNKLKLTLLILSSFFLFACGLTNLLNGESTPAPEMQEPGAEAGPTAAETEPALEETSPPQPTQSEEETPQETQETQPPQSEADPENPCYHPYFPITEGATWTYEFSSGSDYTLTLDEMEGNTVRMTQEMQDSDTVLTMDWYCSEDGILRGSFAQVDVLQESAGEEMPEFTFETLEWEGQTLPDPDLWEVGHTWTSEYKLNGDVNFEGVQANSEISVTIDHTLAAIETVTVPAGTFDSATRVDSTGVIDMTLVMGETSTPMSGITFTFSTWYVEDLGMVKTASTFENMQEATVLVDSSLLPIE